MRSGGSTMPAAARRGGRPKPAAQRKRNNLTFRARDQLRADLGAAAESNRRSLSEEIEHRLQPSFVYEKTIGDVQEYERMRKRAIDVQADPAKSPGRFMTEAEIRKMVDDAMNSRLASLITKTDNAA